MSDPTSDLQHRVSEATLAADERDAAAVHEPDRDPTTDEARDADGLEADPQVSQAYGEAIQRGAKIKGEGAIE